MKAIDFYLKKWKATTKDNSFIYYKNAVLCLGGWFKTRIRTVVRVHWYYAGQILFTNVIFLYVIMIKTEWKEMQGILPGMPGSINICSDKSTYEVGYRWVVSQQTHVPCYIDDLILSCLSHRSKLWWLHLKLSTSIDQSPVLFDEAGGLKCSKEMHRPVVKHSRPPASNYSYQANAVGPSCLPVTRVWCGISGVPSGPKQGFETNAHIW